MEEGGSLTPNYIIIIPSPCGDADPLSVDFATERSQCRSA